MTEYGIENTNKCNNINIYFIYHNNITQNLLHNTIINISNNNELIHYKMTINKTATCDVHHHKHWNSHIHIVYMQ